MTRLMPALSVRAIKAPYFAASPRRYTPPTAMPAPYAGDEGPEDREIVRSLQTANDKSLKTLLYARHERTIALMVEAKRQEIAGATGGVPPGMTSEILEDTLRDGAIDGFNNAIRLFNPDKGTQFKTFLAGKVKYGMIDALRTETGARGDRLTARGQHLQGLQSMDAPRGFETDSGRTATLGDELSDKPGVTLSMKELAEEILRANGAFNRLVLSLRFNLGAYQEPWTLSQIADAFSVESEGANTEELVVHQMLTDSLKDLSILTVEAPEAIGARPQISPALRGAVQEQMGMAHEVLSPRDLAMITVRYGVSSGDWKMKRIGQALDLSESRISQMFSVLLPQVQQRYLLRSGLRLSEVSKSSR